MALIRQGGRQEMQKGVNARESEATAEVQGLKDHQGVFFVASGSILM